MNEGARTATPAFPMNEKKPRDYPKIMSTPEAQAYVAGKPLGSEVRTEEFIRFVERFEIPPIDAVGTANRNRGEVSVRHKWSKRHIDLCLLTGMKFKDALKWAQQAVLSI